jgi:hypothetical protein
MFVRATASAASGEFAVNYNGRNASDAILLRLGSHVGFLHVVDHNLMRRPGKAFNNLDCFLAR